LLVNAALAQDSESAANFSRRRPTHCTGEKIKNNNFRSFLHFFSIESREKKCQKSDGTWFGIQ
jgi:hypothetical protein